MTALVRGVTHGVTPCGPDTDRDQCPTNRRDGYAPTCRFPEADHFGHLCPEENDVNDLSARLVEAARQQIHQFDDDLEDWTPEARKATVAVLRELADTARVIGENVFSGTRLAALADQIEQSASACGVSSEADTTTAREEALTAYLTAWLKADTDEQLPDDHFDDMSQRLAQSLLNDFGPLSAVSAADHTGGAA